MCIRDSIKGDDFTNELIDAIATNSTMTFHQRYRQADVLLVDDIQFIGGKIQTQEEFFHTFNALYQDKKQIVLTSDRPPKEIQTLEDRLRTRFESGLLADIQPPDFETRIAIVKRKAQLLNIDISDDIAEYIASRLKNNIRELEGCLLYTSCLDVSLFFGIRTIYSIYSSVIVCSACAAIPDCRIVSIA